MWLSPPALRVTRHLTKRGTRQRVCILRIPPTRDSGPTWKALVVVGLPGMESVSRANQVSRNKNPRPYSRAGDQIEV